MRDAFGGAFMIKLFLVFIILYVGFTAMSLNYAKAFKVKNLIIDYIEENEIQDIAHMSSSKLSAMEEYFQSEIAGKMNYSVGEYNICNSIRVDENTNYYCNPMGIYIVEKGKSKNTLGKYYEVNTYVSWGVPFLKSILSLTNSSKDSDVPSGVWKISGETRVVIKQ